MSDQPSPKRRKVDDYLDSALDQLRLEDLLQRAPLCPDVIIHHILPFIELLVRRYVDVEEVRSDEVEIVQEGQGFRRPAKSNYETVAAIAETTSLRARICGEKGTPSQEPPPVKTFWGYFGGDMLRTPVYLWKCVHLKLTYIRNDTAHMVPPHVEKMNMMRLLFPQRLHSLRCSFDPIKSLLLMTLAAPISDLLKNLRAIDAWFDKLRPDWVGNGAIVLPRIKKIVRNVYSFRMDAEFAERAADVMRRKFPDAEVAVIRHGVIRDGAVVVVENPN